MLERDLVTIIETELAQAIGGGAGGAVSGGTSVASRDLATERAMELDYYNSRPLGNERDGESQIVSSDVFDAVESMLPMLIKTFAASDDAVVFEPQGEEDEAGAQQRTDAANYVFYRQNNGFILMYEWFKDALIQKNGVVKYWWEEKTDITEDDYDGLTEGEYVKLVNDEDVEVLAHTAYDDKDAAEQRAQAIEQMIAKIPPGPQQPLQIQMLMQGIPPVPQLHDLKIKTTKDASQVCIKAIPPEEFGISSKHNCITIQDAPFVSHRTKMTLSDLRAMGCPDEILQNIADGNEGPDQTQQVLARNRFIDESNTSTESDADPSMRQVWVVDCFIRLDCDGDGIAELRHIIMPSRTIWVNEASAHINFAAITPIIMPHRFIGKSIAEAVMDIQFNTSVLLRQMFNNLYLTNNPQKVVEGTPGGLVYADLDRLMTSRVGGILVEYKQGAIRNQEVPFVAGASFPMLEFMQGMKENRTGVTRYNQGTDADSLNKTKGGISMIMNASQQKFDLVARIFAETGVKDLFRGIAYYLSKHSSKKMSLRLRGKWVDIDPRQWKTQFDMTVNVGLGSGNKDAQLVHLREMNAWQIELMKTGRGHMVTDQNVYNLGKKMAENMGFKHPDMFITDPANAPKPQPAPNPELLKIQQADQESQRKIQSNEKIRLFDAQTQKELEQIKTQGAAALAQIDAQFKKDVEQMRIISEHQVTVFKENNAMNKHAMQLTDQSGGAQQELKDKSTEMALRELELKRREDAAAVQEQIETMAEQHREQLTQQAVAGSERRESAATQIMQTVAGELMKVVTLLSQGLQVQTQSRDLLLNPPPRSISIGGLVKDDKGEVIGAQDVSTKLAAPTIQ